MAKRAGGERTVETATRGPSWPADRASTEVAVEGRRLRLTNLRKPFWPDLGLTKAHLLRYYAAIAPTLVPHLRDRPMVLKRYPHGAAGEFFFMKRAPSPRPSWIETCVVEHSGGAIEYVLVQDLASLLWVVNLGTIDLNPLYGRCDAPERPDFLHFDLDPVPGATFARVCEAALLLRGALEELGMPSYVKTTGSRGLHVYVPIVRGPMQAEVWAVARGLAHLLAPRHGGLLTADYAVAKRPRGRVLVDYNQNSFGRTLASIYSVRPTPKASVSTPVGWDELERGLRIEDFHLGNVPARIAALGDLWAPLLAPEGRFDLAPLLGSVTAA